MSSLYSLFYFIFSKSRMVLRTRQKIYEWNIILQIKINKLNEESKFSYILENLTEL